MADLNIIGNGFDLYHGLPTSYYYFACYLLANDETFYDELANMYGFSTGIMHQFSDEIERGIDDVGYWSNFECNLENVSSSWIEDTLQDDLELEEPDAVDLEIDRTEYVEKLQKYLEEWINSTVDIEQNYEIVKKRLKYKKLKLSDDDYFISFNYTHTLEKVYGIENVFHIHGEGGADGEKDELIFGHGNDQIINELKRKIRDYEGKDYDQSSRNRKNEYKSEAEVLSLLRKPVQICENSLRSILSNLNNPNKIIVWGFSLGDVDEPYIKLIHDKWPKCKWSFSYFSEADRERNRYISDKLGIDKLKWDEFELQNEKEKTILEEIIVHNRIKRFPTIIELMSLSAK